MSAPLDIPAEDLRALARDKYGGSIDNITQGDWERLREGEPLAYVIGWVPFLGLHIDLSSRPLIPRPETEAWTQALIIHLKERFGVSTFSFLDLCAGSGAIGLAVLRELPGAQVYFSEIDPLHVAQIERNIRENELDTARARPMVSDLFSALTDQHYEVIAANPPYIPESRDLPESVMDFEPHQALFAGHEGLALIRRVAEAAPTHLLAGGELWMECDVENIENARSLIMSAGADSATIHPDQYGRPRIVVSYYI